MKKLSEKELDKLAIYLEKLSLDELTELVFENRTFKDELEEWSSYIASEGQIETMLGRTPEEAFKIVIGAVAGALYARGKLSLPL